MPTPLETAIARIEELGSISDSPSHLVRTFLSPASRRAAVSMIEWMAALGMSTDHAADGTIRGILPGSDPTARPFLLGSHYDTVIDAGKYDGPLGIIMALAALESLRQDNITLPFPIHVLAFSDEEGVRFQTTYLGSRSIVGRLDPTTLSRRDSMGITVAAALEDSGWHDGASILHYHIGEPQGYLELHIEQGRVLEQANLPAGVVSSIAGQSRLSITITGRADHAGTTPMPLRRDALTGAAECIITAETLANSNPPLVITVGKIQVHPGASNSIPQQCTFTVDLRHPQDTARHDSLGILRRQFSEIAQRRNLHMDWNSVQENPATHCDPTLTERLRFSLTAITGSDTMISSGAGHDGVILSQVCPIAMLFLRCRDGLSHHPDEYASPEDLGISLEILVHFLRSIGTHPLTDQASPVED